MLGISNEVIKDPNFVGSMCRIHTKLEPVWKIGDCQGLLPENN
nr:hypothetical protein [Escherichia coli]